MFIKKGAMFGLDARIALAIFGALSVISGAALYSAIQDARVTAVLTEMDNIGKATTAYYLDTGVYPSVDNGDTGTLLDIHQLVTSGPTGWQGPYLGFETAAADYLAHTVYGNISLHAMGAGTYADATADDNKCTRGTAPSASCAVFVCFDDITADMSKALDIKADGTAGATVGKYRYSGTVGCLNVMPYPVSSAGKVTS